MDFSGQIIVCVTAGTNSRIFLQVMWEKFDFRPFVTQCRLQDFHKFAVVVFSHFNQLAPIISVRTSVYLKNNHISAEVDQKAVFVSVCSNQGFQ